MVHHHRPLHRSPKPTKTKGLHHLSYKTPDFSLVLESTDAEFIRQQRHALSQRPHRPAFLNGKRLPEKPEPGTRSSNQNTIDIDPSSPSLSSSPSPFPNPATPEKPSAEDANSRRPRKKLKVSETPEPVIQPEIDFHKLLQVAQLVKSSAYADQIVEKIIRGTSSVDKLLLGAFYGEKEFGKGGLTAAHLEAISKALGMPMDQREIYRLLMRYNALFTIDNPLEVMHENTPPHYRLTIQGKKKFQRLLKAKTKEAPAKSL